MRRQLVAGCAAAVLVGTGAAWLARDGAEPDCPPSATPTTRTITAGQPGYPFGLDDSRHGEPVRAVDAVQAVTRADGCRFTVEVPSPLGEDW